MSKPEDENPQPPRPETEQDVTAEGGRVKTGVPRLDFILKGGFFRGGTYTLYGPPGAGKTILANQLCFNHIAFTDQNCVYLTVLAESHGKMVRHLSSLRFFDARLVGSRLKYMAAYQTLRDEGPHGVLRLIQSTLHQQRPGLLVIDGLESIEQAASDRVRAREFLNQLQAFTALTQTTTLLCAVEQGGEQRRDEDAMVDGVIELSDKLVGPRAVRELTVHKFRGSGYLRGRHEVEITGLGVQIHPRIEIQFDAPPELANEERKRMGFGIAELDRMMNGGILSGSTLALLGAPGSGKTTLGLSFLVEGARQGHKGLYFAFYEPPPRLLERAEHMGIPLRPYVEQGMIELVWQPPLEHYMDALAESLLDRVRAEQPARRRLFIDGVQGFAAAAVYDDRLPRFLSALTNQLRTWDVTTLISAELPMFGTSIELPHPELAHVVETVILLRYVELKSQLHRLLSIMKMRESGYDTSIREFTIREGGIEVSGSFESAEQILSGFPRSAGGMS
ncbi:ATPase domain-containing protein [Ramlibacter rhizophilus]|uniref:non-specific serine/threonine protein kinase n=1 Tax=Ramlibacter rhizophilus TaxID=1781167 RepID=A0A4Z0BPN3_9BURK|nr:ATPase domain-containing protein [Ramlibacter rhizophilus]TFY99938.1 NACHT domain-containing protein [Ramlibacter rhizophilus]